MLHNEAAHPIKEPPPYWQRSSALLHLDVATDNILGLLPEFYEIAKSTQEDLTEFYQRKSELRSTDVFNHQELTSIILDYWTLECKLSVACEIACLMCAIQTEDNINRFIAYHFHEEIATSLEKLSPAEKITIISCSISAKSFKSNGVYRDVKSLSKWRNTFAHGHCIGKPTQSITKNHTPSDDSYRYIPLVFTELVELSSAFLRVHDHLQKISLSAYIKNECAFTEQIRRKIARIKKNSIKGSFPAYEFKI